MDLYLHIGTEKTGTTSIQAFLDRNRSRLRMQGVLYPSLPGPANQIALSAAALEEPRGEVTRLFGLKSPEDIARFRARISGLLARACEGSDCTNAVLSNEHCSSRLRYEGEVQTLHDVLRPLFARIFIVVYLRRQDEF